MNLVFIKIASFMAIIAAGIAAGRSGKLGKGTGEALSKIVFNVTLPAAIVHAFGSATFTPQMFILVPIGVLCTLGPYLLTLLCTRSSRRDDRILYLLNLCGFNIGSFGLPLVQAFFPPTTVVAACMFDAGNALMMTGGTYALTCVIEQEGSINRPALMVLKRLFTSIPFDSYIVLIALALLGIQIPQAVVHFTEPMANANGFLSMFMLGLMVNFSVAHEKIYTVLRLLSARALASTIMSLLAFTLLPLGYEIRCIIVLLLWAPIGSMGPVFTLWAGGDYGLAGLANTVSILMSILVMTALIIATGMVL